MKQPFIFNIQHFSIHDGDGIRTTIFFKGCPLNCLWCHNPESQNYNSEILYSKDKCNFCGNCQKNCPSSAISIKNNMLSIDKNLCTACESCTFYCTNNALEVINTSYSVNQLFEKVYKDMPFFEESGGGVTLSGGEVMTSNIDFIEALVKKFHALGISVFIDTSGYAPYRNFKRLQPYVDTFLYDIKVFDNKLHKKYIGVPNTLILDNLKKLSKVSKIHIRIPLIESINTDITEINNIIEFLKPLAIHRVSLLPYHSIGSHKYEKLGRVYLGNSFKSPTNEKLIEIENLFKNQNFNVTIGG